MPGDSLNNLRLLSLNDLIKIFKVSKTTAYRIVYCRKIPFYKINGCIRFTEKDVIKYLEDNKVEPIQYR